MSKKYKDIPGWEGLYMINKNGDIFSVRNNRKLTPDYINKRYKQIVFSKNNKTKRYLIHRLVMLTFVGPSNLTVNHKNGIKSDNRLENLEYVTQKENIAHSHKKGLANIAKGEKSGKAKLTEKEVIEIKKYILSGNIHREIAEKYGVTRGAITDIARGKNWKHI